MSGGITQLVATGVQDAYLSGSPEVSFFRSSYKRYTHFAASVERQLIQGTPMSNGTSLIRFEKKGDLLSHVYFTARDSTRALIYTQNWADVISKVELMIGGQVIDTHDYVYSSNIEPVVGAQTFSTRYTPSNPSSQTSSPFYPLKFFFCKDWQSVLPLVALQYHDVELRITWASTLPNEIVCWSRFIYLDKDEREYFAKKPHDMLITQVNKSFISSVSSYEFALAQPVKFIAFESNSYSTIYAGDVSNPGQSNAQYYNFKIQINGNDIGESRALPHWVDINQYYLTPFGYRPYESVGVSNVAVIPFCLDTSKLQPTGTINFSRIDTFRLVCPNQITFQNLSRGADATQNVNNYFYAVNYNILRIQNGMAGILYAS